MRFEVWLTAIVPLLLAGCGGGDGDAETDDGGSPRSANGALLWSITGGVPYLRGTDTGSGERVVDVQVAEGATQIFALVPTRDKVWIGRDDGSVVVVDRASGEVARTLPVADTDRHIEQLAVGGGSAYVATGSTVDPQLARVDASDYQIEASEPVLVIGDRFDQIVYDGGSLFVLVGNGFAAKKLDPLTLNVQGTTGLGSEPSAPDAFSAEFYGTGHMASVGSTLWVVDHESNRLLRVEKDTLRVSAAGDLADLLEPEDYTEFTANRTSTFLLLHAHDAIVRFDGSTGARQRTYEVPDGVAYMAASDRKLYVATARGTHRILELDVDSAEVTRTFDHDGASVDALAVE